MRLIDADVLKRQFRKRELERSGYYINGADIYIIRKIINGTPTIKERPRGEWNVRHDTMYHFECPFCKYLHQYKDNFCPLCGASMVKKGGDEK